jgi:hypothetical protein
VEDLDTKQAIEPEGEELDDRDQRVVDKWTELMRADFRTAEIVEKVEPMIGWLMGQFGVTSDGESLDPIELLIVLDAVSDNLLLAREFA